MSAERFACITYWRQRDADRRANGFAQERQRESESRLSRMGYETVAAFGDPEFAAPYRGWLEPRPGWQLALAKANDVARSQGSCTLIILQADGIGTGDMFLPHEACLHGLDNVRIRVCNFSLRGHADTTTLKDAQKRLLRYKHIERARSTRAAIVPIKESRGGDIRLRPDHQKRSVQAYYCNRDDTSAELIWQARSRPLLTGGEWLSTAEDTTLIVPANSACHLETFFQDEPSPCAAWWRFKLGNARNTKVGNIVFDPSQLTCGQLKLSWYAHEPDGLRSDDFDWESRAAIDTSRLRLRNWQPGDREPYAKACNTPEVMRFLGGVQTLREVEDDIAYFTRMGRRGPTYWALERLADGKLLGFCGAIVVEEADSPVSGEWEIGWRLGQEFWGHGYAYEAAAEVLRALFEEWGIDKAVCRVDSRNRTSIALAKKLGFEENVGRRHQGDPDQVLLVFEMSGTAYWRTGMTPAALD